MSQLKDLLDREARAIDADPDALDSVLRARDTRQLNRRIGAALLALTITAIIVAMFAGTLRVREPVPGDRRPIGPTENGYYLVPLDGGPLTRFPAAVRGSWFRFSPDGSRVAYVRTDGVRPTYPEAPENTSGTMQIFIMDRGGTGIVQLTHGEFDAMSPTWSEDGRWIAYVLSTKEGGQEIAIRPASAGGEPRVLTSFSGRGRAWYPTWSPDGSTIVFLYEYPNGRSELRTVAVTTSGVAQRLPIENGHEPDWSPDGQHIVFTEYGGPDGGGRVTMADADGSDPKVLTDIESLWPFWSPDGRFVAFTGYVPKETGRYKEVATFVYSVMTDETRLVRSGVEVEGWADPQTLLVSTPGVPNR